MTCKFCGNEIEDGSTFCFICGQPVEVEEEKPLPVEDNPEIADEETEVTEEIPYVPEQSENEENEVAEETEEAVVVDGVKDPNKPGKFVLLICFLSTIIGLILYAKAKKQGNDARKAYIANALFMGINLKLIVAIAYIVKSYII